MKTLKTIYQKISGATEFINDLSQQLKKVCDNKNMHHHELKKSLEKKILYITSINDIFYICENRSRWQLLTFGLKTSCEMFQRILNAKLQTEYVVM